MATAPSLVQQRRFTRERFFRSRRTEIKYRRQLTAVANHVGHIVRGLAPNGIVKQPQALQQALRTYSSALVPWANAVVEKMVAEVGQRDLAAWAELGKELGGNLRNEIAKAPTGVEMRVLMDESVHLITSLPLEAAQRVHRLVMEGLVESTRASEIQKEIMRTGAVTVGRAKLIARTEVARSSSTLIEARATYVGSEGYIWRSSGDSDVRPLHKNLNGKFIKWNEPPISGERGERAHAGQIYNCRCYPDPIIPERV